MEVSAHTFVPICEVCLKILAVPQQLKVDVRQHFRIDKRVSAIGVIRNCFKTTLGQNLETKIDKRDFVAKRSVMGGCTRTLDKHFGEAAFSIGDPRVERRSYWMGAHSGSTMRWDTHGKLPSRCVTKKTISNELCLQKCRVKP